MLISRSNKISAEVRFWSRVEKTDTCWLWASPPKDTGYGQIMVDGKIQYVHRVAYEWLVGPIPDGLVLDHLCRNRLCVNPEHLDPVSSRENILRGVGWTAQQARKTHCIHGHLFDAENTYIRKDTGHRQCRECARFRKYVRGAGG